MYLHVIFYFIFYFFIFGGRGRGDSMLPLFLKQKQRIRDWGSVSYNPVNGKVDAECNNSRQ